MKTITRAWVMVAAIGIFCGVARADSYSDTMTLFKNARESASSFKKCYGYAVFPTIGKAGLGVGGAFGKGRVYSRGKLIGNVSMSQLSVGFQAGGQSYSQMIFFENKRALDDFTSGNFEFGANVGAIAITASASASGATTGASAAASGGKKDAATAGEYHDGMVVCTIAKGGLMYEVSVGPEILIQTARRELALGVMTKLRAAPKRRKEP
jgi:lipid-binding SYLF domain-containing protein